MAQVGDKGAGRGEKTAPAAPVPAWAPRVSQREIRLLYETDARGICDAALIDRVGYGLLARCESFLDACDAVAGRARCPRCAAVVEHDGRQETVLRCACGWRLAWGEYFKTIQHRQLSGAEPVLALFRDFVRAFPAARTPQERLLLIDRLIHGFHRYYKTGGPTRPVAVNLIEGRLGEVVAFLDSLTYGDGSTPGTREQFAAWSEGIEANRDWYPSHRRQGN